MEELKVTIVTPEGVIFDGCALGVVMPGAEGEFGVYPNHCSMISLLKAGVIEVCFDGRKEYIAIDWGYVKIEENKLDILANGALAIEQNGEIAQNLEKAKVFLQKASADDMTLASALSKLDCLSRR